MENERGHDTGGRKTATSDANDRRQLFRVELPAVLVLKPELVGEFGRRIESSPKPGTDFGPYAHIPFCRKALSFLLLQSLHGQGFRGGPPLHRRGYQRIAHLWFRIRLAAASRVLLTSAVVPSYLSVDQLKHLVS